MHCEQAETILALLALGELDGERRADLEAHLADCPACRASLADLRATLQLLQEAVSRLPDAHLSEERHEALAQAVASATAPTAEGGADLANVRSTLRKVPGETKGAPPSDLPPIYRILPVARRMAQRMRASGTPKKIRLLHVAAALFICMVLAGLLLPALRPARERSREMARRAQVNSNLGQLVKASTTYQESNGDFFPDRAKPLKSEGLDELFANEHARTRAPAPSATPEFRTQKELSPKPLLDSGPLADARIFRAPSSEFRPAPSAPAMPGVEASDGRKNYDSASALGTARSTPGERNGQNVGYVDGHVEWSDEDARQLKSNRASKEYLAGQPGKSAGGAITLGRIESLGDFPSEKPTVGDVLDLNLVGGTELNYKVSGDLEKAKESAAKDDMAGYLAKLRERDRLEESKRLVADSHGRAGETAAGRASITTGSIADGAEKAGLLRLDIGTRRLLAESEAQPKGGPARPEAASSEVDGPSFAVGGGAADRLALAQREEINMPRVETWRDFKEAEERGQAEDRAQVREKLVFPSGPGNGDILLDGTAFNDRITTEDEEEQAQSRLYFKMTPTAELESDSVVLRLGTAADAPKAWSADANGFIYNYNGNNRIWGADTDAYLWDGTNVRQGAKSEPVTESAPQAVESAKRAEDSALHPPLSDEPPTQRPAFKAGPVNPWVMAVKDALSTFGIDVDTASYAIARNYIARGTLPPAASVRMEEYVNAFDYNYPAQSSGVFSVHAEAGPSPFGGPGLTLLKVGVRARVLGRDARKPAHLVFVVDASGSMEKPDRMPLVKFALRGLVEKLDPQDRVSLVTFGTHSLIVLESVPAADRKRIIEAVDGLRCGGSTNLLEGLELGYQLAARAFTAGAVNRVVLCSDGIANIGATDADAMLARVDAFRRQGVALTAAGFGFGAYDDVLLERLANSGDGNYVFLDTEAEARRVFVEEMAATMETVAADAKIQVSFDPARVRRYRLIGFENRDIADVDFRNDTVDAGEVGSGQSSTALYELELLDDLRLGRLGDLGTVFVRYRDTGTGRVEEISQPLQSGIVRQRTVKDSPRFFLAACAAQFAELLRGSEHASKGSLAQVRPIIQSVAAELPLDSRVQELAVMVERADGLPRAE